MILGHSTGGLFGMGLEPARRIGPSLKYVLDVGLEALQHVARLPSGDRLMYTGNLASSLGRWKMNEHELLKRITFNPKIFGGKPILRGRRLAVEHVLGMLAAGDTKETILEGYPWLEPDDIQACLLYARRLVGHERIEPILVDSKG
jgi:uncharacterized protein (DUF433 family)